MGEKWGGETGSTKEEIHRQEAHRKLYGYITGQIHPNLLPVEKLTEIDEFLERACLRKELSGEQKSILRSRFSIGVPQPPLDQKQTGRMLNMTPEHVSNQETRAWKKLALLYKQGKFE